MFFLLDIGCNEGNLSLELLEKAQREIPQAQCHLLGIDLDRILIERAKVKYSHNDAIHFETCDIMNEADRSSVFSTYWAKFNIDKASTSNKTHEEIGGKFHFISLFSITMWIHLHHGDEGILDCFHIVSSMCCGSVLVEPQPWKCYRTANKRVTRQQLPPFPHFRTLRIKDMEAECIRVFLSIGCDKSSTTGKYGPDQVESDGASDSIVSSANNSNISYVCESSGAVVGSFQEVSPGVESSSSSDVMVGSGVVGGEKVTVTPATTVANDNGNGSRKRWRCWRFGQETSWGRHVLLFHIQRTVHINSIDASTAKSDASGSGENGDTIAVDEIALSIPLSK